MAKNNNKRRTGIFPRGGYAIAFLIMALVAVGFMVMMTVVDAIPTNMTMMIIGVLFALLIIGFILLGRKSKPARIIGLVVAFFCIALYGMGTYYLANTYATFAKLSDSTESALPAGEMDLANEPFNIYITGIDQWESEKGKDLERSDVNMIVTVNPNTSQVLLVSVPRDSYVAVNGEDTRMDKLTHATFFTGIPGWIKTLETLLGFDMNYFVKVNFSSVVKIIDAIGGLDIDNPYEFSTGAVAWYDEENEEERSRLTTFKEGQIHLTGAEALGYVRERKSLPDGDLGRNLHQTIVIKALVKKAASPEVIMNFEKLLNALSNTFLTNMETKQIIELGRFQLDKSPNWEIMTVSIKGESDYAYSMEVGEELSMLILDQESVNKATYYINAMLNGERISIGN